MNFKKDNLFYLTYLNIGVAIALIILYALHLTTFYQDPDCGYYLRMVECIAEGWIPTVNMSIGYTPLAFYILSPIPFFFGEVSYFIYLFIYFLIQLINAYLIYNIGSHYSANKKIRVFAGLFYLALSYKVFGATILLEPFVNLFGLLALYFLHLSDKKTYKYFVAGILTSCAFFSKQYGLGYLAMAWIYIVIENRKNYTLILKNIFFVSLGFVFFILFFCGLFYLYYKHPFSWDGILFSSYGKRSFLLKDLKSVVRFISINWTPFVLLLLYPPILKKTVSTYPMVILFILGTMILSLQYFFNLYWHYAILLFPLLILIGITLFGAYEKKKTIIPSIFIIGMVIYNLYSIPRESYRPPLVTVEEIEHVNSIIPKKSKVFIFSQNYECFFFCKFYPAYPEKYGFAYDNELSDSQIDEICSRAEYVLILPHDKKNIEKLLANNYYIVKEITYPHKGPTIIMKNKTPFIQS